MNENVCTVFAGVPIRYTKCTWERYCFSNSDLYSPFRFTLTFTYVRNCAKWVICNLHANKHRACRDARTCFGHRGHYSHSRYISYLVYFGYASYSEYVSTCVRELWTPWPAILANHTYDRGMITVGMTDTVRVYRYRDQWSWYAVNTSRIRNTDSCSMQYLHCISLY